MIAIGQMHSRGDDQRIATAIAAAVDRAIGVHAPTGLAAAIRHAVLPGGGRLRPSLCLAAARACGDVERGLVDAAAAAIELLHCASLVHDDLPAFDDADLRRGAPTVHRRFGEPLAILAGDALIVAAFDTVASAGPSSRMRAVMMTIARGATGAIRGQSMECEDGADVGSYHRLKTGALFEAAAVAGAFAGGGDGERWRALGALIGEAYQIADDLADCGPPSMMLGKDTRRDAALGRPNAALELGRAAAQRRLEELLARAERAIPPSERAADVRKLVRAIAARLLPPHEPRAADSEDS